MVTKTAKYTDSYRYGKVRLRKAIDSGIWQAKYLFNGKWTERSTGTSLKRDAERYVDELTTQLMSQALKVADGSIPIQKLFDKFLAAKMLVRGRTKPKTPARLKSTVTNFNEWLQEKNVRVQRAKDLTPDLLRQFQSYRMDEKKVSPRTADNDIKNLCSVFKWAIKERLTKENPADYSKKSGRMELFNPPRKRKSVYTKDEYRSLVAEAEKQGDLLIRDLIVMYANTGLRFQEVASLTPELLDWNRETPAILVHARDDWSPKDQDEVKEIPMLPDVQEVLKRRSKCGTGNLLFTNNRGNKIADNKTRLRLTRLFPGVGINPNRKLHWHSFRRFFIKTSVEAGVPLNVLMSWTGHDAIKIALEYAKSEYRDSMREIKRLVATPSKDAPKPKEKGESKNEADDRS